MGVNTHRGVIGGDVNQDLRGAPPTHVSVAVPHAANQVGLTREREKHSDLQRQDLHLEPRPEPHRPSPRNSELTGSGS